MGATAVFKQGFLQGLLFDAQDQGATLLDVLKTAMRAKMKETDKGKVLIGTTSGGTSVQYSLPAVGTITAEELFELCTELYGYVKTLSEVTPPMGDEAIVAKLIQAMQPRRVRRSDFSGCRW